MLLDVRDKGGSAVLIVDEAHLLATELLDEIRALLGLQGGHENLLQVVLSGQLEIEEKLRQVELLDLAQRVTVRCRTAPLTLKDTNDYIRHRLRIAGAKSGSIFPPKAVEVVHVHSHGIPRLINLLCDHALVIAGLSRTQHVSPPLIVEAAANLLIELPVQRLYSVPSRNPITSELPASRPAPSRDEPRTYTAATKPPTPKRPQISWRLASAVRTLRVWTILSTKGLVYPCRAWSRTWISLLAIKRLLNARSRGNLARQTGYLHRWLLEPWSIDRRLVYQMTRLRQWLLEPWPKAY